MKPPTKPSERERTGETEADGFLRDLRELQWDERQDAHAGSDVNEASEPIGLQPRIEDVALFALSESLAGAGSGSGIEPPPGLRARLLSDIPSVGRFERFASSVAQLLEIGVDKARALLDQLDDASVWSHELPGISFFWVDGGPSVANAVRGFLRVQAGTQFPVHEHLGDEVTLIIQGSLEDPSRGLTFLPGDIDRMPAGSSHDYRVPKDGPDLVKLAVTHEGLRALGTIFLPR